MANEQPIRDVVLLAYKAFGGTVKGTTILQKRVYFLSVFLNADLGYEAHYYGPYSEGVATGNLEMKSLGYLLRIRRRLGRRSAGILNPELWKRIEAAAKVVSEAGSLDYMELSIASKAYFILTRMNHKPTLEDIASMLPKFGWKVSKEELQKATEFLQKANLVAEASAA